MRSAGWNLLQGQKILCRSREAAWKRCRRRISGNFIFRWSIWKISRNTSEKITWKKMKQWMRKKWSDLGSRSAQHLKSAMKKGSFTGISSRITLWSQKRGSLNWETLALPGSRFRERWQSQAPRITWHLRSKRQRFMIRQRIFIPLVWCFIICLMISDCHLQMSQIQRSGSTAEWKKMPCFRSLKMLLRTCESLF